MPGAEEVPINGGLYHDSGLEGTLREAELREQREDCTEVNGGGARAGDGPRPPGPAEPSLLSVP